MADVLSPEALQALIDSGALAPETANVLSSPQMNTPDPALVQASNPGTAPQAIAAEVPQDPSLLRQVAAKVGGLMYGEDASAAGPIPAQPALDALAAVPQKFVNAQYGVQAPQAPVGPAVPDSAVTEALGSETQDITQNAQKIATREVAAERAVSNAIQADTLEQQRLDGLADELALQRTQASNERGQRTLSEVMQDGSFGEKFGAALAVLAGGLSQGLLKSDKNPALVAIDNAVEQEAKKRRLNMEQKRELRESLVQEANLRLKKMELATDNPIKKAQLQKLQAETAELYSKTNEKNVANFKAQALAQWMKEGKVRDLNLFSEEQRKSAVRLPDGSYQLAKNAPASQKLDEYVNEVNPALKSISRIQELTKNYSKVQALNPYDPTRRAIETEMIGLVGSLRLPFTGPGQLLEAEYERLRNAIGNPNKILTMPAAEMAALNQVAKKLKSDTRGQYERAGIDLPMSKEEQAIQKLVQKGYTEEQAERALSNMKRK